MRHRSLAALLLSSTLAFALLLCLRFRSYDLVSMGLCRVAPFSSSCATTPTLQVSTAEMNTQKVLRHARGRGRVSLTIGSLNIRYSRDASYDSASNTMLASFENLLTAARKGLGPSSTQFASSVDPYAVSPASPYLMQQFKGERSWFLRGPKVADVPLFYDWDILAFQEVLDGQYTNLVNWLGEEYDHAGVGRDDGKRAGEAVPVFWRRDTFERVNHAQGGIGEEGVEHFWLSPTPDRVGSVGWDAALTRMCTHVSLRLLATGRSFMSFQRTTIIKVSSLGPSRVNSSLNVLGLLRRILAL